MEIEHSRTVEVIIDYDCYGGVQENHHCAFLKEKWNKIKKERNFLDTEILDIHGMEYFEQMSDADWYSRHFAAHLKDFSDEEIAEEFNRRLKDKLFHHLDVEVVAVVK